MTFFQSTETQFVNFYSLPPLLLTHIFLYATVPDPILFSTNLADSRISVSIICYPTRLLFFFLETHELFYEPLSDTLIRLLSTPLVFLQMVVFSSYKFIFHIVSELSLTTSFVVPHIINHLSILYSLLFLQANDGYLESV